MADTAIATFKQHIQPDVLPCPGPLLEREIRNVIIDFCENTHVLVKEFTVTIDSDQIDTDAHDQLDIELTDYFSNVAPVTVLRFNKDGSNYRPEHRVIVNDIPDSIWYAVANPDGAIYFSWPTNKILRVYDISSNDTYLYCAMSVKPTREATTFDPRIMEHYLDAVVAGVKWKLMGMPNKEWSDEKGSIANFMVWRRKKSQAKARVMRAYSSWPMEVAPRSFDRIDWGV